MKKYLLLSISFLLLVFSCKYDEIDLHKYPGLPDATQSGEKTFGCIINGIPMVVKEEGGTTNWPILEKIDCNYGEYRKNISEIDNSYFDLYSYYYVYNINGGYTSQKLLFIKIKPLINKGKYNINEDNFYIRYMERYLNGNIKIYNSENINNLNFEITKLDTINNIISGLFDLKLIEINNINDTLNITNGRFDTNYLPL